MAAGLRLNNVSHSYGEGESRTVALHEVTMRVEPGEFVAVIGPSGSGKSTFLSVAGALLRPSAGEVGIAELVLTGASDKELSGIRLRNVGFIMQSSNLVPYLNVMEQLLIVKKIAGKTSKDDKALAVGLLNELGLAGKLGSYPEELSGGEKQRVAIARAFMNDPQVILADEPTASLDTKRAHEVVSLIAKEVRSRRKAAIMVTHDERMLAYCDKVYRMEDGRLSLASAKVDTDRSKTEVASN